MSSAACPLCAEAGGLPVWRGAEFRVVRVADVDFPAYYRVICNSHQAELTDLDAPSRTRLLDAVCAVEQVLRTELVPDKINLAALGNMVPHLHWHVIARFHWDSHFPQPIWGPRQRTAPAERAGRLQRVMAAVDVKMASALKRCSPATGSGACV